MVSALDRAKRALVALIRSLAARYECRVDITRDSTDLYIGKAYRTLSRKVHPDRAPTELFLSNRSFSVLANAYLFSPFFFQN